jgi:hypothetical protein
LNLTEAGIREEEDLAASQVMAPNMMKSELVSSGIINTANRRSQQDESPSVESHKMLE